MPKYVIERDLPGAGKLSPAELKAVAQTSVGILREMGPTIQWIQTYVTDDKVYCVYNSPSVELIRKHADCAGFPVTRISQVRTIIDPITAES